MTGARVALPLGIAMVLAIVALAVVPGGIEADNLLSIQDDPVKITERALDRSFDAAVATKEIEAALAADDVELAKSFLDLARDRHVLLDAGLIARVEDADSLAAAAGRAAKNFGHGLITGEPDDLIGMVGTTVGDLFVFGDIRDAAREGARLAKGEQADELILGLACVGLAVTAGTYATLGAGAPARVGLSLLKGARKTGRLSVQMVEWLGRTTRDVVDISAVRKALGGSARLTQPTVAIRAAREGVKVEKAQGLFRMVGDVGRVQSKAGTKAALDTLKLANGPRDVARITKIAEKHGSKTRAILKMFGRGAILLTMSALSLASWIFGALLTLVGFITACKRTAERWTERSCARRRARVAKAHAARNLGAVPAFA